MPKTKINEHVQLHDQKDSGLKGTLISVFIVGALLVATWAGVYLLFLERL